MGRFRGGLLTAGIVAVVGAAGCGGGNDGGGADTVAKAPAATQPAATTPATPAPAGAVVPASDPVAKAAAAAAKQTGAVDVKMTGTIATGSTKAQLNGTGTVDRRSGRGEFTLTPGGTKLSIHEVMDGRSVYITSRLFKHRLPGKRSWMRIDLKKAAKFAGFDPSALGTNGPSQDPTQVLAYLHGAGASKKLGTATIGGEQTTHYSVEVDLAKAKSRATSQAGKAAIDQLVKTLGGKTTIPAEVWIDGQGHIVRERVKYDATIKGAQSGMDFTTTFRDAAGPVKVKTPPASDTVDGLDLIAKSGATTAG
jgi:hypothetical protein